MQAENKDSIFEESNFSNGKLHGKFVQFYHGTQKKIRVSGSYREDKPDGVWKVFDYKKNLKFVIEYVNGNLKSIELLGKNREKLSVEGPPKDLLKNNKRYIGIFKPLATQKIAYDYDFANFYESGLDHKFLYSDRLKKEVAGIIVGNLRFVDGTVSFSRYDNGETDLHFWFVFKNVEGMCIVQIGDITNSRAIKTAYWTECDNFTSLNDYIKGGTFDVNMRNEFYISPNGQKAHPKITKDTGIDHISVVSLVDFKIIKGELWVKLKFEGACGEAGAYDGNSPVWLKY